MDAPPLSAHSISLLSLLLPLPGSEMEGGVEQKWDCGGLECPDLLQPSPSTFPLCHSLPFPVQGLEGIEISTSSDKGGRT